ncbi:MAG: hypothetical protein BIP78_0471 [Candidatus Bipolaricaulis sibiricus]|uniref:Right handed beta helix domain-containing protein n=1 Tax=Bipolaricaulis sibiricus TaxID=2501609 RepID=A0A410FT40_BIPS1|nr:MAG: hypothetical protein BIP78_0471 [Candidatus Bipolaricaulis sibiricus]
MLQDIYVHDTGVTTGWAGVAIYALTAGSFSATFAGANTVVNTPMGIYIMDSLGTTVSLTAPAGTVIFGGQGVAPLMKYGQGSTPNLETTALELGLVGKVYAPESPTPPYNTGVAYYATVAEALLAAIADPLLASYSVVFDLGLGRFVVGPEMQIQRALNAAKTGDTVLVKAGTYVTQALIGKGIVLQGEPGAVIKAPGSQTYTIAESTAKFDPIVFAYGGTLAGTHVSGPEISFTDVLFLTVDGQNVVPPSGSRLVGILYRNVHGTIRGNTIRNLMPGGVGTGSQTAGILVYGDSVVDIIENAVSNYSRVGIGALGDVVGWQRGPAPDPIVNIIGNIVTGNGLEAATGWWAENGIQVSYGATGQVVGNVVSNHWVNNPYWTASGILVVGSDNVSVLDNLVFNNQTSIAVMGLTAWGGGPANHNLIAGNTVLDSDWGIDLQYDALNTTIERNVLSGNYVAVSSWGGGSVVPGGTLVRFNSIAGNAWGLVNYESQVLDAALNWWGSSTGPWVDLDWDDVPEYAGGGDAIYGNVIFSPWLGTDPDGDPTQPGVQINGPVTIIVAPVGPEPTGGYLNTAIAGANTLPFADTIRVREGTYNASTPVTGPTNLFSCSSCPNPATLTGTLSLQAAGILLGRMGEGFKILGDVTVAGGVDASTIHINWNDIYGNVTNSGLGVLDATYNWWGGRNPGTATFGLVNYYPYLPRPVCEVLEFMSSQGLDADAAIFLLSRGGLLSEGLLILDLMTRYGLTKEEAETLLNEFGFLAVTHALGFAFDYGDFVRLLLGYGATPAGGAGSFVDLGIAGGAGAFQGQLVDAIYEAGQPIFVSFELHDFQGNPVTAIGGWVTLIQLHENGHQTIWYWGPTRYNPVTGLQEISIPTRPDGGVPIWYPAGGLPAGYYKLIIALRDGRHQEVLIEIVNE